MAYPKTMTHPNARKSQITRLEATDDAGRKVVDYYGTADMFPPVTVTNEDQEMRHRSQGYLTSEDQIQKQQYLDYPVWMKNPESQETQLAEDPEQEEELTALGFERPIAADPEAVERAYASPYVPNQVVSEWPKMVNGVLTQDPSIDPTKPLEYPKWVHHPDRSKSELDVCVNNAAQEQEARAKFGLNQPEPKIEAIVEEEVSRDPVREKLLSLAELEGVEVDLDWTNEELKQAILGAPADLAPFLPAEKVSDLNSITDKDELLQIATQRGVAVDKRWSVAKIRSTLLRKAA